MTLGKMTKKTKAILIAIIVLIAIILFSYFALVRSGSIIPDDFSNARQLAWNYSQIIAGAVKDTPQNLKLIQQLESAGKSTEALNVLIEEAKKNASAQDAAIKLSGELETMAKEIPNIEPQKSGEAALVAISSETTLIYKLVAYNNYISNLLELLRQKLTGKLFGVAKINSVIDSINSEIDEINGLNAQFVNYMNSFDKG